VHEPEDVIVVTEDVDVVVEETDVAVVEDALQGNGEVEPATIETLVEESASPMEPGRPAHVEDLRHVDGLAAPPLGDEQPAAAPKRRWRLFRKGGDA